MKFEVERAGETVAVEVSGTHGRYRLELSGRAIEVDARRVGEAAWSLLVGGVSTVAQVAEEDGVFLVDVGGEVHRIRVEEETRYLIRTRGGRLRETGQVLRAPMPGRVTFIEVEVGQPVKPGDGLLILEAMKMQNEFKSAAAGIVKEIRVEVGQAVNAGDVLVVIA
jgi:biotin carboxyl carrier protein